MRYHKPDLLLLVVLFVAFGVLATSMAQAGEPPAGRASVASSHLDLAMNLRNWKSSVVVDVDEREGGLNLVRPFGSRGPKLRASTSTLRGSGSITPPAARRLSGLSFARVPVYLFLEKRW